MLKDWTVLSLNDTWGIQVAVWPGEKVSVVPPQLIEYSNAIQEYAFVLYTYTKYEYKYMTNHCFLYVLSCVYTS